MANHKSKSSISTGKPGIDPIQSEDDLELTIQNVICENQVDIAQKMQANNCNTSDDIAREYDAFLKRISQIMKDNHLIDLDVCHLIDPHSANYPGYAFLELTPHGLVANYYHDSIYLENVTRRAQVTLTNQNRSYEVSFMRS